MKNGQSVGNAIIVWFPQLSLKSVNFAHDGHNFLGNNFVSSWDKVEKSCQVGEIFTGGGAAELWPSWPQVEKWCSS